MPFAVLLGEDEIREGRVSLKDMTTGSQELLTVKEAVRRVTEAAAIRRAAAPVRE